MKKHIAPIRAMKLDDRHVHATTLRNEIMQLKRGIKQGDVQNVRVVAHKKKELARTLTLTHAHHAEVIVTNKTTKKETK